jgi:two-component system, chemotaxis family, sensor kinase CheA
MSSSDNAEFIHEFVAESREHLDTGEHCLLKLTRDPADRESVQACFRALHTIKGGAGFMGLERIQGLAHIAEQLLDAVRENRIAAEPTICDALLAAVSRLRELIEAAETDAAVDGDDHPLHERIRALLPQAQPEDYPPSAHAPAAQGQMATSRRIGRPASPATSEPDIPIDTIAGELVAIDPSDQAGILICIDRLAKAIGRRDGAEVAKDELARMHMLAGQLADPTRRSQAHGDLLNTAERLVNRIISARLRRAAGPVAVTLANEADQASGPGMPDAPSIADFLAETGDLLSKAEAVLLASQQPDAAQNEDLFRSFHTVKGMASYLGHARIEQLAHAIESRLTAARDGAEPFSAELHQLALTGIDALRALATDLRRIGHDHGPWPINAGAMAASLGLTIGAGSVVEEDLPPEVPRLGDLLVQTGSVSRADIEAANASLRPGERLGDRLVESGKITREVVEQAASKQADLAAKAQGEGFARVSIGRLEELVNLVGELLITQAMVGQEPEVVASPRLGIVVGRQARVVRDLQSLALSLRLVPLRATFQKMARAVHDTARKLGKQIDFQVVGDDVEVDRTLAEAIADPLLHMVRNAVDHGIEDATARAATSKPANGQVRLFAAHSGDHVLVRLSDDGKGLDPAKLVAKAKEKGLIAADAKLSDSEAYNLIFLPGFSTAAAVTAVSGRGVGMDVVRRNIDRIKGRIDIESRIGGGSIFSIRLPLTTAILDAMVLRVGDERYLVPITSVIEAIRPNAGQVSEVLGRGRVIEARGQLVPVLTLGELFRIAGAQADPTRAVLLVLEREGGTLAVQVDEIVGLQQVVIKPLGSERPHHPGIAGSAIMGDGRVGLIIDPPNLLAH